MPGILPMKVIKVGSNAQSRIAQACDRCRSKKIRCDGIRPCCSQCANVGFECKTSDKLSRRAFPRGYTESLEERVRALESEVRELKELLDEKDEKIDMLSRIHSQSSQPLQLPSPRRPSTTSLESKDGRRESSDKDEIFKVQQSPYLLDGAGSDSYFAGTSSGRTFIEAFKHKSREKGRGVDDIDTDRLLQGSIKKLDTSADAEAPVVFKAPPRALSDQLINIFFQEWAPLFPILHRPTFLGLYEKYVADTDSVTDKAEIAQLNLVFGIAALSSGTRTSEDLESFEAQWKATIDEILRDNSMATLQALILAQLFCVQRGDLTRLLTYKGLSTTLSARLGLHQSQKRFTLGTLTCETRKKVFWTLYTVDSFTAVTLGLPRHIKDADVHCEYPVDADDEYVTEGGFTPTLPGESTKLSSALALFRAARILSKVLEEEFPAMASYELSLKTLSDLSDELDSWSASLPPHLRLHFALDKPSTGTISSRSPLLSLTYHYIRALIQRPAICASLGNRSSSSMIAMASSCKHIIQILQLLTERGLSFSFCLNRDEILVLSGFGLLFQGLRLEASSKILKDNSKMVLAIADILNKSAAPNAYEFRRVACAFLPPPPTPKQQQHDQAPRVEVPQISRHNSDGVMSAPASQSPPSSTRKQLKAIASRFTSGGSGKRPNYSNPDQRRATVHNISLHPYGVPSQSVPSLQPPTYYDPASISRSEPARSPVNLFSRPSSTATRPTIAPPPPMKTKSRQPPPMLTNLDYLSFGTDSESLQQCNPQTNEPIKPEPAPTDWEKLIGSLDNGQTNIYDACYGGPPVHALLDTPSLGMQQTNHSSNAVNDVAWSKELGDLTQTNTNTSANSSLTASSGVPDSVTSFTSDEGNPNSSNEDFANTDWASMTHSSASGDGYRAIVMPDMGGYDEWNSWDNGLNL